MKVPPPPTIPDAAEKQAIIASCEDFIHNVLKPCFLPKISPTEFNYPIDIRGSWAAGRYRFMQRFRSGWNENLGEEFDQPFARIDRMQHDCFNIY